MNINTKVLRRDEQYVFTLRRLYESYGYKKFKMSKFEKYDLYLENKSFLRNAGIVTVTDPKGRLLALKPDITLSIVKSINENILPQKFYYSENVYVSDSVSGDIKEETQVGLEYIGDLDIRALSEILILASESLAEADSKYRIALSHMGFVSEIFSYIGLGETDSERILDLIGERNLHGLKDVCDELSLNSYAFELLSGMINVCGVLRDTVKKAKNLVCNEKIKEYYNELVELADILDRFDLSEKFILDFSVINDRNYYNGLVFQGFINGVPKSVLSGGRYDKLVQRFGVNTSAAGFAVSIDMLDRFFYQAVEYDYDVFLQYSPEANPANVIAAEKQIICLGKRCIALSSEPNGLKYKTKAILLSDGSVKYE